MFLLDSSSIIHAWDTYPIEQFPKFWDWISKQIDSKELGFPQVVVAKEVKDRSPECHELLMDLNPEVLRPNSVILKEAVRIQSLLGIHDGRFGGGVGEADLIIIATAKVSGFPLLSDEAIQLIPPKKMANYKIPAVCKLRSVEVQCWNVLKYIKEKGNVF